MKLVVHYAFCNDVDRRLEVRETEELVEEKGKRCLEDGYRKSRGHRICLVHFLLYMDKERGIACKAACCVYGALR